MILMPHQITALKQMKNGCILCGGVGSGKSRTSLAYFSLQNGGNPLSDIFVPMRDPLDLYIITTARNRDTLEWEKDLSIFLLSSNPERNNYNNKVIVDSWNNIKKYSEVENAFFIFDEQRVVGKGVWVKTFLKIAKRNKWILLSATPGDSWSDYIPVFMANNFFKTRSEFNRNHIEYVNSYYTKYPIISHYKNIGKLMKLQKDILIPMDFKRETIQHHKIITTNYDILAYKDLGRTRWDFYEGKPIENVSKLCYLWRKVCNSDYSKRDEMKELQKKHKKVIVFYNFDYELEILKNINYGEHVVIREWNSHKHETLPDSEEWVYLVQYFAGAEGWNCITTDTIIFFSDSYSYKAMKQAMGRIDRLTTPFTNLYYYYLRSKSPIDLAIGKALKDKKKFNEVAFANKFTSLIE